MDDPQKGMTTSILDVLVANPDNTNAWNRFVERFCPIICGWLRKNGLQMSDVEDVTQATLQEFLQMLKNRKFTYDKQRRFHGLLTTIAYRLWVDSRKKQRKENMGLPSAVLNDALQTNKNDLQNQLRDAEEREMLELVMPQVQLDVEPKTWKAFCLTALDGKTGKEAAEELQMSVAAIFTARSRVTRLLKEAVERRWPTEIDHEQERF